MLPIALIYGTIAGVIVISTIILTFITGDPDKTAGGAWLGYLIMVLTLTLIFFGVKRYRDRDLGGVIKFIPALLMGLAIAAVASIIYVVVWEAYQALSGNNFMEVYAASLITQMQAEGITGEALAAKIAELDALKAQYANPLFRLPATFSEIFPVGLIIALISAALLRNPGFAPATQSPDQK